MLIPKYDTNFEVKISTNKKTLENATTHSGNYWEALIWEKYLKYDHNNINCYAAYTHADQSLMSIKNNNATNNKRILVLKDSKANVVNAHLASAVEYLDIIDLRYFSGSLQNYIADSQPDAVILLQSPFSGAKHNQFGL